VGCPAKENLQFLGAFLILIIIWIIAVLCAAPLYIYRRLIHFKIDLPMLNIHVISYCIEEWPEDLPLFSGSVYYSLFSLALQYFIPILIVSSAYLRIYYRLKKRFVVSQNIPSVDERIQSRRGRRMKRTNCLLISIALIFGVSWLPLNFFNIYSDFNRQELTQGYYVMWSFCHMSAMTSG